MRLTRAPALRPSLRVLVTERVPNERDEIVARLFDEHYRGLCRLAGLLLGDAAAAEEVVQEAFLRTFSGWWRVRHPERAQWYLRASVVNLCRSRLRRRTTEDRGNRVTWSETAGNARADVADVADAMDKSADALTLVALVRRLPPRQRDAVVSPLLRGSARGGDSADPRLCRRDGEVAVVQGASHPRAGARRRA